MPRRSSAGSRSSSSRRSSRSGATDRSGSTGRAGAGSRGGRAGRARSDGKVDIYCPQCAAHYRIAEASMDSKVTCTECKRTFFAKTTVGKRTRAPDYTKVYVAFGIGAVVIIATLIALGNSGSSRPARVNVPAEAAPSQAERDRAVRRDQLVKWAGYVAKGEIYGIRSHSDMAQLATALGVSRELEGTAFDDAFLAAAKQDKALRLLFEMDCRSADVPLSAVEQGHGSATLFLTAREGVEYYDPAAGAQLTVQWQLEGNQLKVTGYELSVPPVVRKRPPGSGGERFTPSADVARPEVKEIEFGGETIKVRESEPVPLGHLEGTTPEQQQQIDELVAKVIASADPESPGYLFGRSSRALDQIVVTGADGKQRKPAVPRLLNALHDLYPDVMGNNDKIKQLTRALLDCTGMQFGYDFRGMGDPATVKQKRESVIRQWFAWWWQYANQSHTQAIDQEEDLDAPANKPGGK